MTKGFKECFYSVKLLLDKIPEMFDDLLTVNELSDSWRYEGIEEFDDTSVSIKIYRSTCGCCQGDYDTITFPITYLWDPDWKDDLRRKVRAAKEEAVRKQNEEAERRRKEKLESDKKAKIEKEQREHEQYEKLKKKFENADS